MTPEAAKVEELIVDLLCGFIDHPDSLKVTCEESANGINAHWKIRCHPEDERMIVGVGGENIKALTFLVRTLGLSQAKHFRFDFVAEQGNPTRCI